MKYVLAICVFLLGASFVLSTSLVVPETLAFEATPWRICQPGESNRVGCGVYPGRNEEVVSASYAKISASGVITVSEAYEVGSFNALPLSQNHQKLGAMVSYDVYQLSTSTIEYYIVQVYRTGTTELIREYQLNIPKVVPTPS